MAAVCSVLLVLYLALSLGFARYSRFCVGFIFRSILCFCSSLRSFGHSRLFLFSVVPVYVSCSSRLMLAPILASAPLPFFFLSFSVTLSGSDLTLCSAPLSLRPSCFLVFLLSVPAPLSQLVRLWLRATLLSPLDVSSSRSCRVRSWSSSCYRSLSLPLLCYVSCLVFYLPRRAPFSLCSAVPVLLSLLARVFFRLLSSFPLTLVYTAERFVRSFKQSPVRCNALVFMCLSASATSLSVIFLRHLIINDSFCAPTITVTYPSLLLLTLVCLTSLTLLILLLLLSCRSLKYTYKDYPALSRSKFPIIAL